MIAWIVSTSVQKRSQNSAQERQRIVEDTYGGRPDHLLDHPGSRDDAGDELKSGVAVGPVAGDEGAPRPLGRGAGGGEGRGVGRTVVGVGAAEVGPEAAPRHDEVDDESVF